MRRTRGSGSVAAFCRSSIASARFRVFAREDPLGDLGRLQVAAAQDRDRGRADHAIILVFHLLRDRVGERLDLRRFDRLDRDDLHLRGRRRERRLERRDRELANERLVVLADRLRVVVIRARKAESIALCERGANAHLVEAFVLRVLREPVVGSARGARVVARLVERDRLLCVTTCHQNESERQGAEHRASIRM
jgi:hypothetical protein